MKTRFNSPIAVLVTVIALTADVACLAGSSSSDEIRAIVSEMTADAARRTSLAGDGSGYETGFFVQSSDGTFRLQVNGFLQFRYTANFRDDPAPIDDFESGFTAPRTLLFLKGHVGDPRFTYQVRTNFNRTNGQATLDDAFVGYAIDDQWSLRWGQGLHAFDREWYHGDLMLQTVERSIVAMAFGGQRSQGVELTYRNDDVRTIFTFSDGLRSANTDLGTDPADYGLTARAEWKIDGEWKQVIGAVTSPRGGDSAAALGGALHFEGGPDTGAGDEQQLLAWTIDGLVKGDGWSLFAAATGYHTTDEAGVAGADFDEYGLVAQGGVYVADDVEIFGRYASLIPDDARTADETFDALSAGVNWFIHGMSARFTLQADWYLDATADTVIGNFGNAGGRNPANSLFGLLPSTEEDQVTLTAQFVLLF